METRNDRLITVVLPVRDRASVIMRTLDSIASQTSGDFRLVIVDNGSTDDTPRILQRWVADHADAPFIPLLIPEPQQGASRARNRGLREADTPYVMFFDSDDEMTPSHIARIADHLRRFPDIDILRWDVTMIDADGWTSVKSHRFHDEMQLHLHHATLSTQRYISRTSLVRMVGGWDETLSTFDDLELGVRLIASASKIRQLHGDPTVLIHHTDESISGPDFSSRFSQIALALDAIGNTLRSLDRPEDLRILSARRAILAGRLRREGNREKAEIMLAQALDSASEFDRIHLRTIYRITRLLGRGGSYAALRLMGKKAEKR